MDFIINFGAYIKSSKEKLYSKFYEEQTIRKVAGLLYIFLITPDKIGKYAKMMQSKFSDNCVHHYNIEILNLFNPEIYLIYTKPMIKKKLKELLSEKLSVP